MDIGFVARVLGAVEPRGVDRADRAGEPRPKSAAERNAIAVARVPATEPGVQLSLSPEARAALGRSDGDGESGRPGELTREEQEEVTRLAKRDAEVRAHENAHKAAAGQHARGGPTYEYERGPDGKRYAVGGEVQIDTAPVPNDPNATIRKMQQVRRAALAPAEPSPQDRRVASEASQQETAARQEKLAARREERAALRGGAYGRSAERPVGDTLDIVA